MDDFTIRRIITSNAVLSGVSPDFREIGVQVRALGDHIESVRIYIVVIPPAGGGCLPSGLILDTTVTLDPAGEGNVGIDKQANVFASVGSQAGFVEFSCTNQSAVVGERYEIIAVVDAHGDDSAACTGTPGPTFIQTQACANALADDDADANNRLQRLAPKVSKP